MSEHQLKNLGKKFEYLHPCSWCSNGIQNMLL